MSERKREREKKGPVRHYLGHVHDVGTEFALLPEELCGRVDVVTVFGRHQGLLFWELHLL